MLLFPFLSVWQRQNEAMLKLYGEVFEEELNGTFSHHGLRKNHAKA